MSFTGSLVLCGIGGLVFKYGGQEAKRDEDIPVGINSLSMGFVKTSQVMNSGTYMFPFKGIPELFSSSAYMGGVLRCAGAYLLIWTVVSIVYFASVLPVYLAVLAFFGPVGIVIAYVHFLLQTNMLSMMVMRMTQLNNSLFEQAMRRHGREFFVQQSLQNSPRPTRYYIPFNTAYYWLNYLPWRTTVYSFSILTLLLLLLISFVPILGPLIFSLAISPIISRIYFSHYLRLRRFSNRERTSRFYSHFGEYTVFGAVAGLLETIPLLSALAYSSNALGTALMAIEDMDCDHIVLLDATENEELHRNSEATI